MIKNPYGAGAPIVRDREEEVRRAIGDWFDAQRAAGTLAQCELIPIGYDPRSRRFMVLGQKGAR